MGYTQLSSCADGQVAGNGEDRDAGNERLGTSRAPRTYCQKSLESGLEAKIVLASHKIASGDARRAS
jgi:hypothetical protein